MNEDDTEARVENCKDDHIDVDEILPQIGEFGRYQKLLIWLVCLPACIPCGFGAFNQLFMQQIPDHWCKVPELNDLSPNERRSVAIPYDNKTYSRCSRYAVNWTEILNLQDANETFEIPRNWTTEPCIDGWEYNLTEVKSSIVIDFGLVCDYDIYPTIGLAALNSGGPIGVYVFGLVNDRIGRKRSFFICLSTLILGNVLTALSVEFWQWAISRAIVGLTIPAVYQIPFIICLELVGPNYRSFVTVMTCVFYIGGLILLSVVSFYIRNWVHLAFLSSLPFTIYFISGWFLPESPRWLLSKGRFDEALDILDTLAKINGATVPPYVRQRIKRKTQLKRSSSERRRMRKGPGVTALFRTPNMRLKTILITFNWFANDMVYVGLSYYGPALGNNEYLSFFLSSVIEIPSCMICWFIMDRWGRRWPLTLSMLLSGISCIVTVLLPENAVMQTLVLFLFSKFTISASFLIIYPFAGELYPTPLRGIGIGFSTYVAGLGLIIIPFVTYLGRENLVLPLGIMGVISIVGGITALRLPETLYHNLPQTVDEGENFGKNWSFSDCFSCPRRPVKTEIPEEFTDEMEDVIEMLPKSPNPAKPKLRKQMSVLEVPSDDQGLFKMTHWV
ncbi:carcinine transporter [Planococcus citri]|uniref:carcinine transporter n=1 Tax=Planococcus citri TaxID=170843 RepID=UPI0031F83082